MKDSQLPTSAHTCDELWVAQDEVKGLFHVPCLFPSLVSIFTVYLICVHLTFTRVGFLGCSFTGWQYKRKNRARDQGTEHAAVRAADLQSNAWQWTWLLLVPKISLRSLNFSASTSHQWSGFSIHYSFKCCMFQISSFGNERTRSTATYIFGFVSPPHTWSHAFYLLPPSFLSLSLASALLPANE